MTIDVKYFASLRDRLGRAEDRSGCRSASSQSLDVWAALWPETPLPPNTLTAVNMEYAEPNANRARWRRGGLFPAGDGRVGREDRAAANAFRAFGGTGVVIRQPWTNGCTVSTAQPPSSSARCATINEGESVRGMTLEHYPGMTERHLQRIVEAAFAEWPLLDALVIHRVGDLQPNDPIVLVAVWSAHRAAAFAACRFIMEELKSKAPFWKREDIAGGARWVEHNTPG